MHVLALCRGNMVNKVFVYDDVLLTKIQNILDITPADETIAEATGKMYMVHRQPVMLNLSDIAPNRGCRKIFGSIMSFEDKQMEKVLIAIDNYKGYSLSRLGVEHPCDLTYRTTIEVYPISFTDIHQLENFRYRYERPVKCHVYLGNVDNPIVQYKVKGDRHHKITNGVYIKGFKSLLRRKGYIDD